VTNSGSNADKLALKLKNAYGDRVDLMVSIDKCECPADDCGNLSLETEQGDYGKLDDKVWCHVCEWEGTCRELLTEEAS